MERLALIGVSHRRGGASALETYQQTYHQASPQTIRQQGFSEWAMIVTCNRWDFVTHLPRDMSIEEARNQLGLYPQTVRPYAYIGDSALEQLTRVAASLDSLNPGEDQIMAQVREAYRQAQAQETTGNVTSFAFNTALKIAKRIRREVALAPMNTSLFSLARPAIERNLKSDGKVAVIGTGAIGTLAAKSLASLKRGELIIVNRHVDRARQLAQHLSADYLSLEDFLKNPPNLLALVTATPVAQLIGKELLAKLPELKLLVDLGMPRNVSAPDAKAYGIEVLDIDSLQEAGQERKIMLGEKLAQAEQIVQAELDLALSNWTERQLGPSIKKLRDWYLETIGDSLPEEEAVKLAHKFAHVPTKGLRALAREYGIEAAKVFLAETGLSD